MQFLRTIFWIGVTVVVLLFSFNNWTPISVALWGGIRMDTKLPVLVIGAFLLGLLPLWIYHRAAQWRLRRRLETSERMLGDMRTAMAPPAVDAPVATGPSFTTPPPNPSTVTTPPPSLS